MDSPCVLHIPHKQWAKDTDHSNPHQEADNYAYLEQWSTRFGECFPAGVAPVPIPGTVDVWAGGQTSLVYDYSVAYPGYSNPPVGSTRSARINPYSATGGSSVVYSPEETNYPIGFVIPGGTTITEAVFSFTFDENSTATTTVRRSVWIMFWDANDQTSMNAWEADVSVPRNSKPQVVVNAPVPQLWANSLFIQGAVSWGDTGSIVMASPSRCGTGAFTDGLSIRGTRPI